jgi:hypothetical protein
MNSMNPLFTVQTWYHEQYRPVMNSEHRYKITDLILWNSGDPLWAVHAFMNSAHHKKKPCFARVLLVYRMTKLVVHYSLQFKIQIIYFFIYVEYKLYILEAPFSPCFHVSILTFLFNKGERKYKACIKNITENNMVLLLFYSIRSQNEATFGWASAYYYSVTRS